MTPTNTRPERTDWDDYYSRPFATSKVTRGFTQSVLARLIRRFAPASPFDLVEIGGANSCFFDRLSKEFSPRRYHIIDSNALGMDKMSERIGAREEVVFHRRDVLGALPDIKVPLVFSVGLVEHFSPDDTARAINAHFDLLTPGGVAIISFPTPTIPYRLCRRAADSLGIWIFHDERPLRRVEVEATVQQRGDLLHHEIVWPIVLTQMFIVARKR